MLTSKVKFASNGLFSLNLSLEQTGEHLTLWASSCASLRGQPLEVCTQQVSWICSAPSFAQTTWDHGSPAFPPPHLSSPASAQLLTQFPALPKEN